MMPIDYRYDPFSDTSTAVAITNELHVIPTASPFTIRLSEVPDKTAALTMKVRDILSAAITDAGATSITVSNGAWFTSGKVITVDSEQMLVGSVAANTLTVTRGYNSTVATTHTSGTSVLIEESMTKVAATPASGQFWPDYSTEADNDKNWNTGLIQFNAADAGKTVVASYNGIGTLASVEYRGHQLFTSSGTFTVPKGVKTVYVTGCGGGGGGSSGSYITGDPDTHLFGFGGGAGACVIKKSLSVTPGQSYTITIGSAGSASSTAGNGGTGGTTSFGSLFSISGGGGGIYRANQSCVGGSSGGFGGGEGWQSKGGNGLFGNGGITGNPGGAAFGYGAGGGGGYYQKAGGAGTAGMLLIEW